MRPRATETGNVVGDTDVTVRSPSNSESGVGGAAEIERKIAPTLADMGYDIVRVLLSGQQRTQVQIMVEWQNGGGVTLGDCVEISRTVGAILEVEDPIAGAYTLEVSSPGLDRPLTRLADFERFAGRQAKIETRAPVDGRRRWRGRLLGVDGNGVRLAVEAGDVLLPFPDIVKAKLVLSDDLFASRGSGPKAGPGDMPGNTPGNTRQ